MHPILQQFLLAAPLFVLVSLGYGLMRWARWPGSMAEALNRFVFTLALPAMLFRLMTGFADLPPVDSRLLIAFFGGAIIVFLLGRVVSRLLFGLDGAGQSVFAMGAVFSNNVLLGIPIAKATLGEVAIPSTALVLVFNALVLWSLMTISIEWSRHGRLSLAGIGKTTRGVLANPLIIAILSGAAFGLLGLSLPAMVDVPLEMVASTATPLALIVLGMGLAEYDVRNQWQISLAISAGKLVVLPLVVWVLAWSIGLPRLETQVAVLLSSMATGINVHLMSRQFKSLEAATSGALVLSTALAAFTTPVFLALLDI